MSPRFPYNPKIIYKFPSREREDKFFSAVDNIHELSVYDNFEILATFDIDDSVMANERVKERLLKYPKVRAIYGTSNGKIHACNRDMEFSGEWDIVILMSDDFKFLKRGFDADIILNMFEYFPYYDGVIHFPDSHAKFNLITMSIMGREYYNRFNYLYNPEYYSVFADNEFTDVSRLLNKYAFIPEKIMDHFHFIWGMCEKDALYERNENKNNYYKDNQTYLRRKADWFGLNLFK